MAMPPLLALNNISKRFQQAESDVLVLDKVSFQLASGRSVALRGESGCGKSTLLHLIAGLDRVDQGEIRFNDQPLTPSNAAAWRRSQISLVFQQYHLIPTLNVADNMALQAKLAQAFDEGFYRHLLHELGLSRLTKRFPHQLSGGQQQRVAIGRALLHRPNLILADEPTGNLDEATSEQVMQLLVQCAKEAGSGLFLVTHSTSMAQYLDEQWYLHQGQLTREG